MRHQTFIILTLLSLICWGETYAQEKTFSKETFSDGNMTLQYRKANISGLGDKAALVIYLHGGSGKGNDNEAQMQEPGINAISTWLYTNNRKAIMLAPQCPTNMSWLGAMQDAVYIKTSIYGNGRSSSERHYIR